MHAANEAAIDPASVLWDDRRPVDAADDRGAASVWRTDCIAAIAAVVVTIVAFAMMFGLVPEACALTGGPGALVPC